MSGYPHTDPVVAITRPHYVRADSEPQGCAQSYLVGRLAGGPLVSRRLGRHHKLGAERPPDAASVALRCRWPA